MRDVLDPRSLKSSFLPDDSLSNLDRLFLQDNDWKLWRIKCTVRLFPSGQFKSTYCPFQPNNIIYELMNRHETLSDELRSAFYNPRDANIIYLEAKFTKYGIASLYKVL